MKYSAARIDAVALPGRLLTMGWTRPGEGIAVRRRLLSMCAMLDVAIAVPFQEGEREGVMLRAAHHQALPEDLLQALRVTLMESFQVSAGDVLSYQDLPRQSARTLALVQGKLAWLMLLGDLSSEHWLGDFLRQQLDVSGLRGALLMSGEKAPLGMVSAGRAVCSCAGVRQQAIEDRIVSFNLALEDGDGAGQGLSSEMVEVQCLRTLQSQLGCGAQCGSCVPELRTMIRAALPSASGA